MKRSKRVHGLAFGLGFLALALALTGCGEFFTPVNNNPGGTGTTSYVYAINSGGTLAEYSLASGVLTELSGSPITLPVAATSVVVAPNDASLYVGTGTGVFLFTINSDGTLTEGNNDTVIYLNSTIVGPVVQSMVVDPSGAWLIMAYQNSKEIDALPMDVSTGLPTGAAVQSALVKSVATNPQLAINPANTQVFITLGVGGTEAIGFTHTSTTPWAATGTVIPVKTANASASGVSIDSTSTYLYITEQNSNASGTALAGTVRLIATASLGADLDDEATGIGPTAVLADLSGAYAYVTNSNDGTISGYSIDTTSQKLTSLGTSPTEASPVALVEDKSKSYIIDVGNGANPNLWLYAFDSSTSGVLDVKTTTSTLTTSPSLANGIAITH